MKSMKTLILAMLFVALMVSLCVPARVGGVFVRQGAGNGTPVIYTEETLVIMESQRVTFDVPSFLVLKKKNIKS